MSTTKLDEGIKLLIKIAFERNIAERKAFEALAGYKFYMFGYWAAAWVKYNALLPKSMKDGSPFKGLVTSARNELGQAEEITIIKSDNHHHQAG